MIKYFKAFFDLNGIKDSGTSYQNIRPTEARVLMKSLEPNSYEIIDVRTPEEYKSGHVEGAKLINLFDHDFVNQIAKLDPDKTYFLICRSGNRSGSACSTMARNGFSRMYNISGGMISWK